MNMIELHIVMYQRVSSKRNRLSIGVGYVNILPISQIIVWNGCSKIYKQLRKNILMEDV